MSDNKEAKNDNLDWSVFHDRYFDALKAFNSQTSFFNNISANSFWDNAMDQWWNSVKAGQNFQNEDLFEKIVNQGRNYHFFGDQFSNLINGISNYSNQKDINKFINKTFKDLQSMISQTSSGLNWSSFTDSFEMPFAGMNKNKVTDMFNFSKMFDFINPEIKAMREKFLSMPGIGYSRETQEKFQKLIKLAAIYQDNATENQKVMTQLSQDALELMRKNILKKTKKGESFDSIRQIYDLWVESNEKVYADYAFTEEYSELNGRLVNSQMALMKLSQEINDDLLTSMNIPTNKKVNELERRQYELRKKVKTMEVELKTLTEAMNKESTDTTNSTSKAKPVNARKKKTAKKKVSKKKAVSKVSKTTKKKSKKKSSSAKKDVIEIKF